MRRIATLALTLVSLATPLAAQSHPDFSGTWALDTKTSEGPMMPSGMTVALTQDAKTLKVESTATMAMNDQKMEQKSSMVYSLDGSTAKNTLSNMGTSVDLMSTTAWEGPMLVVTTNGDLGGGRTMTQVDHWTMDADHKTLHLMRDISAGGQSVSLKMVFNKQ
jgi:hypothetical protein